MSAFRVRANTFTAVGGENAGGRSRSRWCQRGQTWATIAEERRFARSAPGTASMSTARRWRRRRRVPGHSSRIAWEATSTSAARGIRGSWWVVITIQRVRIRWTAATRGALAADVRRGLDTAVQLPAAMPDGEVVVQDVLADEAAGYERSFRVFGGGLGSAEGAGLLLAVKGSSVVVGRLPGWAAYPRPRGYAGLFTLGPGQVGRWRANFRFTGCSCSPSWYFEDWLVHVGNGVVDAGRFVEAMPDREVVQRVHLYGGAARSAGRRR